jgi:hypothetical protein
VKQETLAQRLGTTTHLSPLLLKAAGLGLRAPEDLERLAVRRGCLYYDVAATSERLAEEEGAFVSRRQFSNAELAVSLLSPFWPASLLRQRMGAAMLSAPDVDVSDLAALARREGCVNLVSHIAKCGSEVEPELGFWREILLELGEPSRDTTGLPHPTRFVEMTGINRGKIGIEKHWIRPVATLALAP